MVTLRKGVKTEKGYWNIWPVDGLDIRPHGGGCCGVKHLYAFPTAGTSEEMREWLKDAIDRGMKAFGENDYGDTKRWRGCIEVTLNELQLNRWDSVLTEAGFEQVFTWRNDNSGNRCYMYLLETNRR